MGIFTFINGEKKRAFTYNPRVCIGGVIHKILEGYTFVNGERKKLFGEWDFLNDKIFTTSQQIVLPAGTYQFIMRGAGGAGGTAGRATTNSSGTGIPGNGGAGGKGELVVETHTITEESPVFVYVGAGGLRNAENGNGGFGGTPGGRYDHGATGGDRTYGCGGGGGMPSLVVINNETAYFANGGGGGGGGGGGSGAGRYSGGSGGGAGGGYYKCTDVLVDGKYLNRPLDLYYWYEDLDGSFNLSYNQPTTSTSYIINIWHISKIEDMTNYQQKGKKTTHILYATVVNKDVDFEVRSNGSITASFGISNIIESRTSPEFVIVNGKDGAGGGSGDGPNGYWGIAGNTTDFPDISSGAGGTSKGTGGSKASGGGASGGGGGYGSGNHSSANGADGGGGAGGSTDAHGGFGGKTKYNGEDGSNASRTATSTLDENSSYGVNANYGMGGGENQNGTQGFVLIKRIN